MGSGLILKLYVTGQSPRSLAAITNLGRLQERFPDDVIRFEIIDVLEKPEVAENERITVTPLLVRRLPPPERRVIGDLSDTDQVVAGLGLDLVGFEDGYGRKA